GVPIERCHLIRPGVDFAKVKQRKDGELRTKLGFGSQDYVVLALGESIRAANHHATILSVAVLNVLEPNYKLLLWGRGPHADFERDYGRKMLPANYISVATDHLGADVPFEQLLGAADAVMISSEVPVPTQSIATCMAAAVPIVAVVSATTSELL